MQGLKTIYNCDHKIASTQFCENFIRLPLSQVDNEGNLIFFIPKNITPVCITDVCVAFETPYQKYSHFTEYVDYVVNQKDGIVKILKRNVNAEDYDLIKTQSSICLNGVFSYLNYQDYSDQPFYCSRCHGAGWYVDLLSDDDISVSIKNKNKLTQEVIKILFTDDMNDYGCPIKDMLGQAYLSLEDFSSKFSDNILLAENRIIDRQSQYVSSGGKLNDDDLLREINIIEIASVEGLTSFRIVLQVISVNDTEDEIIINL